MIADRNGRTPQRQLLFISAKYPHRHRAKTRLGKTLGPERAAELYRAFLLDLADRYRDQPYEVCWLYTPAGSPFTALVGPGFSFLAQEGNNWTERQVQALRWAFDRGYQQVLITASDSPHEPSSTARQAFSALESYDVVLQPTEDGGYQLLGTNGFHDVLSGLAMSTTSVFEEIRARCAGLGLRLALLPPTFDVDEEADLALLEAALRKLPESENRHTRAVLAKLGIGPEGLMPQCGRW